MPELIRFVVNRGGDYRLRDQDGKLHGPGDEVLVTREVALDNFHKSGNKAELRESLGLASPPIPIWRAIQRARGKVA